MMASAIFAALLENLQHLTQRIPKSQQKGDLTVLLGAKHTSIDPFLQPLTEDHT